MNLPQSSHGQAWSLICPEIFVQHTLATTLWAIAAARPALRRWQRQREESAKEGAGGGGGGGDGSGLPRGKAGSLGGCLG